MLTNQDLLDIIIDFYKKSNKVPTKRDLHSADYGAIVRRFGTWNEALTRAGFSINRKEWTKEEVLDYVRVYLKENGYVSRIEWDRRKKSLKGIHPSTDVVLEALECTSWDTALKLVDNTATKKDIEYYIKKYGSFENLKKEIKKEILKIGNASQAKYNEFKNEDLPPHYFITGYISANWNDFLKMIEIEPENEITDRTDEQIISDILDLYNKLDRPPSSKEFEKEKYSVNVVKHHFGTWNKALGKAKLEARAKYKEATETDEELIQMYVELCKKLKKIATREDIDNDKEIYSSGVFAVRFGGIVKLQKLAGFDVPKRKAKYTKDELEELIAIELRKNKKLTKKYIENKEGFPNIKTFCNHFKTSSFEEIKKEVAKKWNID